MVLGDSEEGSDHDEVWDLTGHEVLAVDAADHSYGTLVLLLTGEQRLEIEPDTDLDPSVLRLPGMTYVGGLTPE